MTSVPVSVKPLGEWGSSALDLTLPCGSVWNTCQKMCSSLSRCWASQRPEVFSPTGISSGCATTLHASLNFCGLVRNSLIFTSCKNESWLMNKSVFHHQLETDSYPCVLALDLIFL